MNDLISYHIPEAIRIHINAVNENGQPLLDNNGRLFTLSQFSVDPQITNFTVLESIIVKVFNLNGDFILTYLNRSLNEYVQLKSDWDLECAYLGNAKPYLDVKVQKINTSNLNDWDIVTTSDLNKVATYAGKQTSQLANNFLNRMEKMVFKAFNKPQFEEELDENSNVANQQIDQQSFEDDQNQTGFSKFNLLSKFKRRSTINNELNQLKLNQQICPSDQQTKLNQIKSNPLTNQQTKKSIKSSNNRNNSNLSTSSIRNSDFSLTCKDLSKNHTINKKDLKAKPTNKIKKISSVQDNQILHKILGNRNASKTNLNDPLTEQQYLKYLHPDGRIKCLRELRLAIYRRGIESSLRSTLYKHLLNVYPPNMTSEQRRRFIQQKSDQYYQLCFIWQRNFRNKTVQHVHNQVRKDVLRTDRSHPFYVSKCNLDTEQQNDITSSVSTYSSILTQFDMKTTTESSMNSSYTNDYSTDAGIDNQVTSGVYENRNVQALTNILTTYALNHKLGYWQGMSDLCSPLLLAIQNEADTYICFTALMRRLSANFNGDECMANKFDLLRKLLQHYDPEFFEYLEEQQASDLLFCYRWLLLELKREFKLDNALYMLEVSWASQPPKFYPDLPMYNMKFVPTDEITTKTSTVVQTNDCHLNEEIKDTIKSSPKSIINNQNKLQSSDAESLNSSKTLSSFSSTANHQFNFGSKLKESNNIKNLKNEMTNVATDLGRDLSKQLSNGVNQIKKSVEEVANVASEFYANLNSNSQQSTVNEYKSSVKSTVRSTLKGLKLSSVEEQLAYKREKFHQQNTTGHSVSSLNDMRFSLDRDQEGNQRKSKNSSLNGSNHSLVECNSKLNSILNKTQAMFKEQTINKFNFNLINRKESTSCLTLFKENNKENRNPNNATRQNYRHIRFLPKILSTDSNDNTIDSPDDADDLNEKCGNNFPHLINKQFSIDSVDSLEFNYNSNNETSSTMNSYKSSSTVRQPFNNNFTCFSNFNNLPFANNLPFIKQNSIPTQASLLKQQLKQSTVKSFNQQTHIYHFKQRSLPSSPLFKKKLDSFERPFLPFLQNVSNIFDKHMNAAERHSSTLNTQNNNIQNTQRLSSVTSNPLSSSTFNRSKLSKLVSNQFDSFDQHDLFVHCNGENETTTTNSTYNSNWKPERGLLNCFDSTSFDSSSPPTFQQQQQQQQTQSINNYNNSTINCSHQRLARQLSDKLINEKMHNSNAHCVKNCEERDAKKILAHTQSINNYQPTLTQSSAAINANVKNNNEFKILRGQLAKLNLSNQHNQSVATNEQLSIDNNQYLKTNSNSTNSSTTTYEKEEKSEGYCSGSISDRNSNYEDQCTNLENELVFTTTFSNSTSSLKSSASSSSSSISSLSCSSSLVILSSNTSFRSKIAQIEKLSNHTLPSPHELMSTGGNAFMLFICLTILLLHRDKLINDNLDANDMAIYFDSHVRRHDVHLVVNIARELFQVYLNKWQGYQLAEQADQSILESMLLDGQSK